MDDEMNAILKLCQDIRNEGFRRETVIHLSSKAITDEEYEKSSEYLSDVIAYVDEIESIIKTKMIPKDKMFDAIWHKVEDADMKRYGLNKGGHHNMTGNSGFKNKKNSTTKGLLGGRNCANCGSSMNNPNDVCNYCGE